MWTFLWLEQCSYFVLCLDIITELCCFYLACHGHTVALSDTVFNVSALRLTDNASLPLSWLKLLSFSSLIEDFVSLLGDIQSIILKALV